jgi:thiol-disulfide isomerase/thioredoxin
MKHNLRLSSLILSTILACTGCMKTPEPVQEEALSPEPENIVSTTNEDTETQEVTHSPTATRQISYHLKSIQGHDIEIIEGRTGFTFPQYQDKIVILEIFGKECKYCMEELPMINKLRKKYGDELQVIAVQAEEPMKKSEYLALKENYNMTYPIIERDVALNVLYSLRDTYGWTAVLPYVQIIKNGVTQYQFPGETSAQALNDAMTDVAGY